MGFADVAVVRRVEVDVIAMLVPILLVTNTVFPIARLPNTPFVMGRAILAQGERPATVAKVGLRERPLDVRPTNGEVVIGVGQGPKTMKMIREQHAGDSSTDQPPLTTYHKKDVMIRQSVRRGGQRKATHGVGNPVARRLSWLTTSSR